MEWLRWRLHRRTQIREDRTPSPHQDLSTGSNRSYRPRSRTQPSESLTSSSHHTFGWIHYHRKSRTPSRRGQGHDAMASKYPAPLFLGVSNKPSSLITSTNPFLPFIMVRPIILNMWATLIKEWPSIPRIKSLCVKSFPQALVRWPWGGLIVLRKDLYILLRS